MTNCDEYDTCDDDMHGSFGGLMWLWIVIAMIVCLAVIAAIVWWCRRSREPRVVFVQPPAQPVRNAPPHPNANFQTTDYTTEYYA